MELVVVVVFVLGYLAIALEHNLKIDKLIPALIMMGASWTIVALSHMTVYEIIPGEGLLEIEEKHGEAPFIQALLHHLGKTSEILFFLIGAMTIVEIIEQFHGFSTIKQFIKTQEKAKLLWIFSILAFVLSAIIDNLTATIVLITILRKIIHKNEERVWFAGMIIIAANAGGAWSPIGDVTTTMLWIAHKVEVTSLVKLVFLPSLVCMIVPVLIISRHKIFQGKVLTYESLQEEDKTDPMGFTMLVIGLLAIIFVPFFKIFTHLPPYIGMSIALGVVAMVAEIVSSRRFDLSNLGTDNFKSPVHSSLTKIELPSILFFLGILLAVAALESLGTLFNFAGSIKGKIDQDLIAMLIGVGSAVIDNVPLIAASIGMFDDPNDNPFWHFIAFTAGTGGSMLIIGSAAGVVAMGMEKINFFWYFKNIAWLAFLGYVAGSGVFILLRMFLV